MVVIPYLVERDLVDIIKARILSLGNYLRLWGWIINAVTCLLTREAEEDLKQTMGRGAAMDYGADWSDAAIRQGTPAA